jgi:enamine deaminase RidA (YjgF/YER057c/UK114 family)
LIIIIEKIEMIKPLYQFFKSECAGSFGEQWNACFESFERFLNIHTDQKAFVVRVFVSAGSQEEYESHSNGVKERMDRLEIPFSVLAEAPAIPALVLIEAGFVHHPVEYGKAAGIGFCKIKSSGYSEYWLAGVESGKRETVAEDARNAFACLLRAFQCLGIGFNQVYRQWNYVEQIFGIRSTDGRQRQNYQLFNEARAEYYSKYRTISGFPAATGIGTAFNGVTIECMVVANDEGTTTVAISNPKQLNSYTYGQDVLEGDSQGSHRQNQAPQFERARLITNGWSSRLFISGTASIIGQKTVGVDDVAEQTRVTIENIALLASETNLRAHYPALKVVPDKYACVRVYVKNSEDFPVVKTICSGHFRDVPVTFVQADICRADLLVEIEAEMVN